MVAHGTIAFDTLTTSDQVNTGTEKSLDTSYIFNGVDKFFSRTASDGASTNDSFNQSGLTDTASGRQDFAFTNAMSSTNYVAHVQPHDGFANEPAVNTIATTGFRGDCNDDTAGDRQDVSQGNTVHGDLA